jgi:hypothetical protein
MAKPPFKWPNNARIAFVLGIAFEAWDRNKPSRGGALQSPLPANALCKRDYSTETFREFGGKIGVRRLLDICDRMTNQHRSMGCPVYWLIIRYAHGRAEMVAHGWDQGDIFSC